MNFDASGNQFTGSIPSEIGNISNLLYFSMGNNQISGEIPAEFGKLSRLKEL
jgi:Leucine-rich repeat (LRR) protein